jgi:hypothetical protein
LLDLAASIEPASEQRSYCVESNMSEMLNEPVSSGFSRLTTEFYRWLPASVLFLFYVAGGGMIFFTCAIALVLAGAVSAIHSS